jgi:hypothetical protein
MPRLVDASRGARGGSGGLTRVRPGSRGSQLLRQAKPHRLLVEPSGLGHPAGLVRVCVHSQIVACSPHSYRQLEGVSLRPVPRTRT